MAEPAQPDLRAGVSEALSPTGTYDMASLGCRFGRDLRQPLPAAIAWFKGADSPD